jgi:ketosteroid isomerase-like protein
MPARKPEELDQLFTSAMNVGDLDALVALYETDASMTLEPGQLATGHEGIREAPGGFLAMQPTISLECEIIGQAGDIALGRGAWELNGTGADGEPVKMSGQSAEVYHRQPDGTWLFAIDNPFGLG